MSNPLQHGSSKFSPREICYNNQRTLTGGASIVVFLIVWQLIGVIDPPMVNYLSSPQACFGAGWLMLFQGEFWNDLYVSGIEFIVGFLLAVSVGLVMGIGMGIFKRLAYLLEPVVMTMNTTPHMALIPIIVMWFGIGMASKMFLVFLGAVIPIIVNIMVGIRSVDPNLLRAGRSFGATRRDLYVKIYIPSSLPAIMGGVRLGVGRGLLGMIIGEMYVAFAGLGNAIVIYGQALRVNELIFMIVLVSVLGFMLVTAVGKLEKRWGHWKFN